MTGSSVKPSSASNRLPGLRALRPGEVHLWLGHRDEVSDSATFCRKTLSQYADPPAGDWQFEQIGEGKPRLLAGQAELDFNISHSGDLLVCAVTSGFPVGVDIEREKPKRDVMRLARRFYSETEVEALEACPPAEQRNRFYDLWTLKEATVKSQGESLPPRLKKMSFRMAYEAADCATIHPLFDDPSAGFALFEPAPKYRLAVCLPGEQRQMPSLKFFRWSSDVASEAEQPVLIART